MKQILQEKLQSLINRLLQQQEHALYLQGLTGRIAVIVVKPVNITLNCLFSEQGITFLDVMQVEPHVVIEGSPLAFLAMNISSHQLADIFAGKIKISGDIDTAQKVQNLFNNLNLDWEEYLSQYAGDPVAHYAGKFVKRSVHIVKKILSTVERNTSEYLQEEINILPTRIEIDNFLNQVDMLRNDIERLEANIRLLEM